MSDAQTEADGAPLADTELTIVLDTPVKVRNGSYDTMLLREPTGRQVRQAETLLQHGINVLSLRRYQVALIVAVSGWPLDAVEELPVTKLDEAGRFIARFTNIGQAIGAI